MAILPSFQHLSNQIPFLSSIQLPKSSSSGNRDLHPLYDTQDWSSNEGEVEEEDTAGERAYSKRTEQSKEEIKRNQIILGILAVGLMLVGVWLGRVSKSDYGKVDEGMEWSGGRFDIIDVGDEK